MTIDYVVTGGAGFIGSHLARRLASNGASVRVIDNLLTGNPDRLADVIDAIDFIEGDLGDQHVVAKAIQGARHVFHLAAVPSVQRSVLDPIGTNQANVTATQNHLETCRRAGVRRVVYAASSSAYGDTEVLPKSETMPADPLSPYALQKFVGERYCKLYNDLYSLETVSLRYFNVFGPGQDPNSEYSAVIPKFINALLASQPVTIYGDGEQSRDFTYVENVVDANLAAMRADDAAGKVFNIGCGERITLSQLVAMLERILDTKATVQCVEPKPGDVRHSLADIGLSRRILDYRPRVLIEEGLKLTVEAMRRNQSLHGTFRQSTARS